ncbi:Nn.00g053940.m01.CDS01 [Neocucurbitaria sp. VM-36]
MPGTNGGGNNRTYDRTGSGSLRQSYHVTNMSSPSTHSLPNLSPETILESDWPQSIRDAAMSALYPPSRMWQPQDAAIAEEISPNRTMYQAIANTPYSFYSRSLEMALPEMQYGAETLFDEYVSSVSSEQKSNVGVDNLDDIFGSVGSHETTASGSSIWSDRGSPSGVLQYHLIGTCTTDVIEKENLPIRLKTPRVPSLESSNVAR